MAYSGYKIITYIDVNPQSPTFNTTRTERVSDTSMCPAPSSDWQQVSSHCEVDSRGMNTGYFIVTSMDMNLNSPTYGQTRETRTQNLLLCRPQGTSPKWSINEESSYCQTKIYQPSQVEGETGVFMASLTDDNRFSPTFGQRIESALTESDWNDGFREAFGDFPCKAPDTSPQVEEVSYACVLSETSDGQLLKTGEVDVTGIDKNVYSPTYLQSTTVRKEDYDRCPPNNPNKCACSALTIGLSSVGFDSSGQTKVVGYTLTSGCELSWTPVSWVTIEKVGSVLQMTAGPNTGTSRREASTTFSVGKNFNCHTLFFSQEPDSPTPPPTPTSAVTINFNGVTGITTGGLMVTGSSYTAEFSLAYNTGTLYGTLVDDPRTSMTFTGQFTTSTGGGNIVNACGTEQGEIYAVTSATWNVSTNTLNVGVSKCTSPTPTTCSVIFHVTNSTTMDLNGSVEVFWGTDMSRSFSFDVDGLSPGSSKNITKGLTSEQCGQTINTVQFESPSLNTPMNVNGSRMLNDGTTINLEVPNS